MERGKRYSASYSTAVEPEKPVEPEVQSYKSNEQPGHPEEKIPNSRSW